MVIFAKQRRKVSLELRGIHNQCSQGSPENPDVRAELGKITVRLKDFGDVSAAIIQEFRLESFRDFFVLLRIQNGKASTKRGEINFEDAIAEIIVRFRVADKYGFDTIDVQ